MGPLKHLPRPMLLATILTLAYLLGLAFNIAPWLRGPNEWRWAYAVPATIARLWLPGLLLCGYVLLGAWLVSRTPTRGTVVTVLLVAALMTPALQLALLYMDHLDVKAPLFYRTVSESSGGYFNVGATVSDIPDFLRHFAERMATYPIHPQRHPPGLPWLFALARQFLEQTPALTRSLNALLRPYQCASLALMNLPDGALASSVVQMIVPVLLGLVVWPLYALGRRLYDEGTASRAALLWPLIPSIALWATRWDQLFAVLTIGAFLAMLYALQWQRLIGFYLSGLIVSVALFFNFGLAVIGALLVLYAALWFVTARQRPSLRWVVKAALAWLAGLATVWIALYALYQVDPFALWRTAMGIHLGLDRSYFTWLFFHPYDFFVFLGIPIAVLWFARTGAALRDLRPRRNPIDLLALTFLIGLTALILSGTSRGEVARVWAFLIPLPLLIALSRFPPRAALFAGLLGLVALQVFVSNIFLRTVGTGLTDPPAPPISQQATASFSANWAAGMAAQTVRVPHSIERGQALNVDVSWAATAPITRPYTIFVHLIDANGQLAAQYDNIPLQGAWPTTCWQIGQSFSETLPLAIPPDLPAGRYQLRLGFYWLPNLERAPIGNSDSFDLGAVEIQ
jgi:hypothetical protein